jgi:hypothetical protein
LRAITFAITTLLALGCNGARISDGPHPGLCENARKSDFAFYGTIEPVGPGYSVTRFGGHPEPATDVTVSVQQSVLGSMPPRAAMLGTVALDGSSPVGRLWDAQHRLIPALRFVLTEDGRDMIMNEAYELKDGGFTFPTGPVDGFETVLADALPGLIEHYRTDLTFRCPTDAIAATQGILPLPDAGP